jgi:hypothetical protein
MYSEETFRDILEARRQAAETIAVAIALSQARPLSRFPGRSSGNVVNTGEQHGT